MNKKNAPSSRIEALQEILIDLTGNSGRKQRRRMAEAFRRLGSFTTLEARKFLDILCPAARVWELIHREGWQIGKVWERVETAPGLWHRVARYFLVASPRSSEADHE
jgi:Helix-turn-helix domain